MKFSDVVGQKQVKERLLNTIRSGRVPHAQLFTGPEGSGKLATALAYGQYLNCTARSDGDSCGVCPSCIKYNKLVHPDLHFIFPVTSTREVEDPASRYFIHKWRELLLKQKAYINLHDWYDHSGIDRKQAYINTEDCQEIIRLLNYTSYEGNYKVMVVWMIEKLFHQAAPRLLKILEEPPDSTLFILISEHPELVISTILSRTQEMKFPRVATTDLSSFLKSVHGLSDQQAWNIADQAGGNVREAVLRSSMETAGEPYQEMFERWMRLSYSRNVRKILDFVQEISALGRERQKSLLEYTLEVFRNSFLLHAAGDSVVRLSPSETEFLSKFRKFVHPGNVSHLSQEVQMAIHHVERNANPGILFTDLTLKIGNILHEVSG
ncbi:MAG: DNA polymerase III subunit delta [Bacteroidales bacterium]|nr:DNA polymerase III subunit delta [Bacteroidales bacterium]